MTSRRAASLWLVVLVVAAYASLEGRAPIAQAPPAAAIALHPSIRYQTIIGWEAVSNGAQLMENRRLLQPALFDAAVNDVGINRVRLEVRAGSERKEDVWSEFRAGRLNEKQFHAVRYATENDNGDDRKIDWSGFHFSELDFKIEEVVNPLRALLEARGEALFVNVNYVAFIRGNGPGTKYHHHDPDEYAEFVLATYQHIRDKYGWTPDAWEVILEPDNNTGWDGVMIGRAIAESAKRLIAAGFTPNFIGPSNKSLARAPKYFEDMMSVRGARPYVSELSYHRYNDVSEAGLREIARTAAKHKVATSMLEHIGSGYEDLHQDLKIGNVSAWEQYVLSPVGPFRGSDPPRGPGGALFVNGNADPANPRPLMLYSTRLLRQYFRFVRRGAVRIEATTSDPAFDPVAFVSADGGTVVVVKAQRGGAFRVAGLPAGTYGVKYTTETKADIDAPDATLTQGQDLPTSIPAKGVLTVFRR